MNAKRFFLPTAVHFGKGALACLSGLVKPGERVFFVTDQGLEAAGLAERALGELKAYGPTMVVALGGGSPADLGKILAALATNALPLEEYQWNGKPFENPALPFVAIPTTAGTGSEVTRVAVIVSRNAKKGINSDILFPTHAILDPELMAGLPVYLTATTGMDALTHAIEAYVGLGASPITDAWAEEAIRLIGRSLWRACANGNDLDARADMAMASCLAGVAMDQAGLGMVHAMSGPMCGHFHLAHGESNAILLEYVMRYNLMARPEKFAKIAELLGCETDGLDVYEQAELSVEAVRRLFEKTGAKPDLTKFGITPEHAPLVAEETRKMFLVKNNPRVPSQADCEAVFLEVLADYGIG